MPGKKRPLAHIRGDIGINIVKNTLPQEWVVREYNPDYGIDIGVELFEPYEDSFVTKGEHIFFQVKTTDSIEKSVLSVKNRPNVEKTYNDSQNENVSVQQIEVIKFIIDTSLLETVEKMGSAVPVILAVVDASTEKIYFVCLNDYIEKVLIPSDISYTEKQTKTIYIPANNILDNDGVRIIEWYAKRAKLYALFNKINYQRRELEYCSEHLLEERIIHFIKILMRLDAWSATDYFPIMKSLKEDIEYYLNNNITKEAEQIIECLSVQGKDVDEEIWENSYCAGYVSLRKSQQIISLISLWDKLTNLGDLFEDICKEYFLPTSLNIMMNN